MEENSGNKSSKKALIVIGAVVVGVILIFAVRAICINASVDHAYNKATQEYNRAYDKAKSDYNRALKDLGF